MSFCRHTPAGPLSQYIDWFWYYDELGVPHHREHVLPSGTFELIINLDGDARKLFDREKPGRYQEYRKGWLSGTHSGYIVIDVLPGSSMMGAHFKPGGAAPFLGMPADELCDGVVELDAVWSRDAWDWRDRMLATQGPRAKFRVLEELLLERMREQKQAEDRRQRVQWAVGRLMRQSEVASIGSVVDQVGISHKHFIEEFRREVGMAPKLFCRIRRFQDVLARIEKNRALEWAAVAYECGYADQAHFIHDFQVFSGVNPTSYLQHETGYTGFLRARE